MSVLKAKLRFSFLCDYASVSREGKLNLNGIFENINIRTFPGHHPIMFIVANIAGVNNKDKFTCELIQPGDKKIAAIASEVKGDLDRNFGFIGQFVNVRYEMPGQYWIKFYIDNKEIGMHRFAVRSI
ncbi:MAG: hypothetical protein DRP78_03730 [Candidatus Omnitrophota bacterium]|nr:MAG: hypothetical protein DRP78_03730 [Candidatus Omnitrophota bacterium]